MSSVVEHVLRTGHVNTILVQEYCGIDRLVVRRELYRKPEYSTDRDTL